MGFGDMKVKEINVEGMDSFAKGATGECFRVGADQALKLYYEDYPIECALQEKIKAKTAFVSGIPTAISYNVVKAGNRYGILYEMLNSKTLSELIAEDPENAEELGKRFARLAKDLHNVEVNSSDFPKATEAFREALNNATYLTVKARKNILVFLDRLDRENSYVHGDFQTNNIMLTNDECLLIDMGGSSVGSPLIDLATIYFSFFTSPEAIKGGVNSFNGLTEEERKAVWDSFIKEYFNECTLDEQERQMEKIRNIALIIEMRYEALFGKHASPEYCDEVRCEVLSAFG